jgi:hypothetical protein
MNMKDLVHLRSQIFESRKSLLETPGGNADVYQRQRLAGKAIRKTMKTKGGARWVVGMEQRVVTTRPEGQVVFVRDRAEHGER